MTDASDDFTPKLSLPFLLPSQAQKHVTVNESLAIVDALTMASVTSTDLNDPPTGLSEGDAFIVADTPTGDWAGHSNELAIWVGGVWKFHAPKAGWRVWDENSQFLIVYRGDAWLPLEAPAKSIPEFGINTDPDPSNRLAVKSDALLFSHDDITPGTGDVRVSINKDAATDTGSMIFQTGYSARAEMGLVGDDDFSFRVSPDGNIWTDCLRFDRATGHAGLGIAPTGEDRLRIDGQISITGADGSVVHQPSGRIELHRGDINPVYVRSMSHGNRFHFGATTSDGVNHNNALVLIPNSERIRTTYTIGPWSDTEIDLGFSTTPFRDLYLTNAPVISSDMRSKTDIEMFDAGLELLQALHPVTFRRKGKGAKRHVGLIAQQVRDALDQTGFADSGIWSLADPDDEESHQAVAYAELIPVLIDAVNEISERLEDLEAAKR